MSAAATLVRSAVNVVLTEEMYKDGFTEQVSIDISQTVVKQMQERCKENCPNASCILPHSNSPHDGRAEDDVRHGEL